MTKAEHSTDGRAGTDQPSVAPPFTDAELAELRASWSLDPARAHLNHGSFGAVPKPVAAVVAELHERMAFNPIQFFGRTLHGGVDEAADAVAQFLRGDADGLSFVQNATAAGSTVMASAGLAAGDEVVVTNHAYGAIRYGIDRYCADAGARVVEVAVPRTASTEVVNGLILEAVNDQTRLVVADHITSPTARLFDVAALGGALRQRGVGLMVDGAHAPGTLDIDLRALTEAGVSVWFGNLHKWVCAPPGTAVLYADEAWRRRLRPLVVSWSEGAGYPASVRMQGTADVTGWLAAPAAIAFHQRWGYDRVRAYGRGLVAEGARLVAAAIGLPDPGGDDLPMRLVPLPAGVDARDLHQRAVRTLPVELAVTRHDGNAYIRLAAHLYNQRSDYQVLADGLPALLEGAG
jgi:isopenicillin-N epimerase